MKPFLEALNEGALVLDGAMGTQLYERGVLYSVCYDELNVTRPELVTRVHDDYLRAGAQIIETNTFGGNAMRLEKFGLQGKVRELNLAGVKIARQAAQDKAWVAGAIGPSGYFLGEASDDDLGKVRAAITEQTEALVEGGVDLLLIETIRQPVELEVAIDAARKASKGRVPIAANVSLDEAGFMADGTNAEDIARRMKDLGAVIIGVNCSDGPMGVLAAVERMIPIGLPVMAVPNAGLPRRVDDRLVYISTPEYFGVHARRMFKIGVKAVGGCCGTTPDHIRRIAAAARMAGAADGGGSTEIEARERFDSVDEMPAAHASVRPVPMGQRSKLGEKIDAKTFVVSVEVNPPIGLDLTKALAAARMLKAGGVDVINISDGARAQARMGNVAMASRIQREIGMETILHVCGRDRNLLASLAHLLSAHELGVRNLVIITGDPPKMGDFPDATPVYDLDSIGLLKLAQRLNHGVDPAGKPIGQKAEFVLATGAEPAALNYDREITRLRAKKASGAELVMTQPVYDVAVLRKFLDDIKPLGLPVLVGLLPLASYRNAEFLHNEVPGMQVPEAVRERMRKAGTGPSARKEGVAIAREMLEAVRSDVAGAYVMPPLERYELALEVIDGYVQKNGSAEADPPKRIRRSGSAEADPRYDSFMTLPERQSRNFWEGVAFAERFFMGQDEVSKAMQRLCKTLEADAIPYAIAGAMALNAHGYRRVTTDVDVLLTREGLATFKERHLGRGWVELFAGSKGMRDAELGVKIDVLITGDYPGDGKPKPIAFPDPAIAIASGGVRLLPLESLIELKLASGMTNPDRMKDLADVQELIRATSLGLELGQKLHEMVRAKYEEIWNATKRNTDE